MPQILNDITKFLDDKKCENILTIDVSDRRIIFDAMIIASCTSNRHIKSTADALYDNFKKTHHVKVDGDQSTDWVVVEIDDILVHLFKPETRELYKLEELWHDRPSYNNG